MRLEIVLHAPMGVVDAAVQREFRRSLFDLLDGRVAKESNRIVPRFPPHDRIELTEQGPAVGVERPPQVLRQRGKALMRRRDELSQSTRLADQGSQLSAGHHQHPHIVLVERTWFDRLNDEHTLEACPVDDGHTEERLIGILAGLSEIFESWV
jgi:hypothetical protein